MSRRMALFDAEDVPVCGVDAQRKNDPAVYDKATRRGDIFWSAAHPRAFSGYADLSTSARWTASP